MQRPDDLLARIVAEKHCEVAARKVATSLATLSERAAPTSRSLKSAIGASGTRFILEHKRASPSKGPIRPGSNPRDVAKAYLGAADAISVLTDHAFFGGSFDDLRAIRAVVDLPILCKDFVVDPYQVVEARSHGADAVLLMMSVLDDRGARACLDEATRLGMDALVEVHDESELRRAVALEVELIGINNRDLRTLAIDLSVTERLAPLSPPGCLIVAESGIEARGDVERLAPLVDAFLVGSSLMRAPDIRDAARALVFGRVKICGLTSVEDAVRANRAGAALGGLIFASASPRCISDDVAAAVAHDRPLPLVGVFVDESIARVASLADSLHLTAVQLHGEEDAAYVRELRTRLPLECAIWHAAHVQTNGSIDGDGDALRVSDRIVFDSAAAGVRGGTGLSFDWDIVASHERIRQSVLAGGIGPDNAVRARAVGAFAIDVGSRIERSPGKKDPVLLDALFTSLRGPGRRSPGDHDASQ